MSLQSFLTRTYLFVILPLALISSAYLFLYPFWHLCAFPETSVSGSNVGKVPRQAPFRLLALADPQIEGDTRLNRILNKMPKEEDMGGWKELVAALKAKDIEGVKALATIYWDRIGISLQYWQKWVDIWGNDLYLAHVFRTMYWYTKPSHVVVLGDLLSSHWIKDEEFERRGGRFWDVIFRGMQKVEAEDVKRNEEIVMKPEWNGEDVSVDWSRKVINIAGNHDVGYAGDMTKERIERFERTFGQVNYMYTFKPPPPPANFTYPAPATPRSTIATGPNSNDIDLVALGIDPNAVDTEPPTLRIMVLNSLALDTPVWDKSLSDDSYNLLNAGLKSKSLSLHQATLLLTHLPFYKPKGVCTDGPLITYYEEKYGAGIKKQNHLSDTMSGLLLGWIFGLPTGTEDMDVRRKARGMILTGHDHPGCDVWHYFAERNPGEYGTNGEWSVLEYLNKRYMEEGMRRANVAGDGKTYLFEGVREVTVKSMMGEFGGNAGLLSAWFDWDDMSWRFEYDTCALGVQHLWWLTHIVDVLAVVGAVVLGVWHLLGLLMGSKVPKVPAEKKRQ
ncbi:hypothetical protein BDZ91DRAFT_734074 [Kalaharituber pfeilii]|nr:hypothetical protein BDZ91DRAFT_734074 [Kalaharituber pfeilii]